MTTIAHSRRLVIVSGGQTGVDRGALDAALEVGCECGGWCPPGRMAEDGPIPDRYPLIEIQDFGPEADGYRARTRRNVECSDATLILCVGRPSGGTAFTLQVCRGLRKPAIIINAELIATHEAGGHAAAFVLNMAIQRLNVAGPRASGWPDGYAYARDVVRRLCSGTGE
jgi:hypothetical protein